MTFKPHTSPIGAVTTGTATNDSYKSGPSISEDDRKKAFASNQLQGLLNGSMQLAYVGHTDGADKGGSKPSLGFMA